MASILEPEGFVLPDVPPMHPSNYNLPEVIGAAGSRCNMGNVWCKMFNTHSLIAQVCEVESVVKDL